MPPVEKNGLIWSVIKNIGLLSQFAVEYYYTQLPIVNPVHESVLVCNKMCAKFDIVIQWIQTKHKIAKQKLEEQRFANSKMFNWASYVETSIYLMLQRCQARIEEHKSRDFHFQVHWSISSWVGEKLNNAKVNEIEFYI